MCTCQAWTGRRRKPAGEDVGWWCYRVCQNFVQKPHVIHMCLHVTCMFQVRVLNIFKVPHLFLCLCLRKKTKHGTRHMLKFYVIAVFIRPIPWSILSSQERCALIFSMKATRGVKFMLFAWRNWIVISFTFEPSVLWNYHWLKNKQYEYVQIYQSRFWSIF